MYRPIECHLNELELQQAEEWQWSQDYQEQQEVMEEYHD